MITYRCQDTYRELTRPVNPNRILTVDNFAASRSSLPKVTAKALSHIEKTAFLACRWHTSCAWYRMQPISTQLSIRNVRTRLYLEGVLNDAVETCNKTIILVL